MDYPTMLPLHIINAPVPTCCGSFCGTLIPLVLNGSYNAPSGEGRSQVDFNVSGSPCCGISIARVLRGDLEGLVERDDLALLNPRSSSMRLEIQVGNPSPARSQKLTYIESGRVMKALYEK